MTASIAMGETSRLVVLSGETPGAYGPQRKANRVAINDAAHELFTDNPLVPLRSPSGPGVRGPMPLT
jgi:hypothetical protein